MQGWGEGREKGRLGSEETKASWSVHHTLLLPTQPASPTQLLAFKKTSCLGGFGCSSFPLFPFYLSGHSSSQALFLHLPSGWALASLLHAFSGGSPLSGHPVSMSAWMPASVPKSSCSTVTPWPDVQTRNREPALVPLPVGHQVP